MKKIVVILVFASTFSLHSQVYLNREGPINSSEVFGITKNVQGGILTSKFGGMYIETTNSTAGKPFYGYAMDGEVKAYQYFDGSDEGLHLYNSRKLMSMWKDSLSYDLGDGTRLFYNGAKLEFGKGGNTFIGKGVTPLDMSSNIGNTVTGWLSARTMTSGVSNSIYGFRSAEELEGGDWNTIVGSETANKLVSGVRNTMVGFRAGWNSGATSSGNVFIGNRAGEGRQVSNKLVISNSETSTALIEGDFETKDLVINGDARIEGNSVLNGETSVFGQLSSTSQITGASYVVSSLAPFIDFKTGVNSQFYIQYQPVNDELVIHKTGLGDVVRFGNTGEIYYPQLAGGEPANLKITSSGKIFKEAYPTSHEYFFLEELNTPIASDANMIVVKDLMEGEVLTELVVRSQWSTGIFPNPTQVGFYRLNKVTKATQLLASLSNLGTGFYNQEFTTTFNHIVDTDANIYYLLVHEDSSYSYIKLNQ